MSWYCKLIGHTFVFKTENPTVSWNTGKDQKELHITASGGEPKTWLECQRCGHRVAEPTSDQIKQVHCNVRQA